MRAIFVYFCLLFCCCAYGQSWSASASIGAQYHLADKCARPALSMGLHRDTDERFSLSLYLSITETTESDNVDKSFVVSVTPALTTHIWDSLNWSVSLDLGIGVGHTFSQGATDHSHHTYLIAVPVERYVRQNMSVYAYPALLGRTWQGHIGYSKDYSRIALYVGYRIML